MCYQLYNTCNRGIYCQAYGSDGPLLPKREAYRGEGGVWPCVMFYLGGDPARRCPNTKSMYRKAEDNDACSVCHPDRDGPLRRGATELSTAQLAVMRRIGEMTNAQDTVLWALTEFVHPADLPPRRQTAAVEENGDDVDEGGRDFDAGQIVEVLDRYQTALSSLIPRIGRELAEIRAISEVSPPLGEAYRGVVEGLGMNEANIRRGIRRRSGGLTNLLLAGMVRPSLRGSNI